MLLKELKNEDVKVDLRVWNLKKTQQGTIVKIDNPTESRYINDVHITWDDGQESWWWAWDLELKIVEPQEATIIYLANDNSVAGPSPV